MRLSGITTKRELVGQALREFIAFRQRLDLRELKGTVGMQPGHDYKGLRGGVGSNAALRSELP